MSTTVEQAKDTIRKLLNLARDDAATEGEVNNAIRFARKLMLAHQLEESDCEETEETESERIAKAECDKVTANSQCANSTSWEGSLALFCCKFVGGVKCYRATNQIRRVNGIIPSGQPNRCTVFTFYGIAGDTVLAQQIFSDMSVTVAAMGRLKWGGAFKGPGREYCEGFVAGLFEQIKTADTEHKALESTALTVRRTELVAQKTARADAWLRGQGVRLGSARGGGGGAYHGEARADGRRDGARAELRGRQGRLT